MLAHLDAMLATVIVLVALAFIVRRFTGKRAAAPACAPPAGATPQVIVGGRLARAMANGRAEKTVH